MTIIRFLTLMSGLICSKHLFTIFQLKDYKTSRYLSHFRWYNFTLLFLILLVIEKIYLTTLNFVFECMSATILPLLFYRKPFEKTPLKITKRIKYDYILFIIISTIMITFSPILYLSLYMYLPAMCNALNLISNFENYKAIKLAKAKIRNSKAKVIAITGSNGKTTIKNILKQMLSTKYNVIASPKSFNTPLGNASFINKELTNDVDYIILEYGARRPGDIHKLCSLFGADYGIISCVAPQHLKYFKSIESVYKTKKELSDYLGDKLCIYNANNIYTYRMFLEKQGLRTLVSKSKTTISNFKSKFLIFNKPVTTDLLGEENILDIKLSAELASHLGVDKNDIINSIRELKPTEHRLQYIKSRINILDDSYNCSLLSAKQSIDVINSCKYKKMVLTPGIIEGGKNEYEINHKLGKLLSGIDYVILVGNTNKEALTKGIKASENYKEILYAETIEKAKEYFALLKSNDCLLILNDLPDDYS